MSKLECPICQSQHHIEARKCSTCGWDLTPYVSTFSGQIPEPLLEKEKAHLTWAKDIWKQLSSIQRQTTAENSHLKLELKSTQDKCNQFEEKTVSQKASIEKLNSDIASLNSQYTTELEQVKKSLAKSQLFAEGLVQEKYKLEERLKKFELEQSRLQSQLQEIDCKKSQLDILKEQIQSELTHAKQELSSLQSKIEQNDRQKNKFRSEISALKSNLKDAEQTISKLKSELSEIQKEYSQQKQEWSRIQKLSQSNTIPGDEIFNPPDWIFSNKD